MSGERIKAFKAREATKDLMVRLGFGVLFGAVMAGVMVIIFSPSGLVLNLLEVVRTTLVMKVRELPLFGLRKEDVWEHMKALFYLKKDLGEWVKVATVFGVFSVGMTAFLWLDFYRKGGGQRGDFYRRGSRLVPPRAHNLHVAFKYRKSPPHKMGIPLKLGRQKVVIPEALQYRHFAFMGAAGYGKSTAIEEILAHAKGAGHKCLVVDLNGIFYSRFGRSEDHLLSLRDGRSRPWSFWSEGGEEDGLFAENMAAALVEEEGGSHQYFWKGARALLASLLRVNSSIEELHLDLRKPVGEIRKKLQEADEISTRVLGDQDGDQADGILGTVALDFSFLGELKAIEPKEESGFSITRWMRDDKDLSWVFLSVREQDLEQTRPLVRLWFDLACLAALQRVPDDPESPHVWLVIDEVKSIGRLPSLPGILDKGRKYKTSVVLGFQALSQLQKIYGDADSRSILQGLQNQFFFRMTEPSCSEYASRVIGCEEVDEVSYGVSLSQKTGRDHRQQGSINQARRERSLVMPEEIRGLETLEAYAKICHHNPVKLIFEVSERRRLQSAFVPRIRGGGMVEMKDEKTRKKEVGPLVLEERFEGGQRRFEDDFLG